MKTLEITVAVPCKMRCPYCPQTVLENAYKGEKIMRFEVFKKALDNVPKDVAIHFSGFCEPLQNPETQKMMKYAREQGYRVVLYTTFTSLDKKLLDSLADKWHFHYSGKKPLKDILSRAGNLWEKERKKGKVECISNNYDSNIMLPNGDVYLCCMDYGLKHKIGNILKTNYNDLKRKPPKNGFELCHYCELSKKI